MTERYFLVEIDKDFDVASVFPKGTRIEEISVEKLVEIFDKTTQGWIKKYYKQPIECLAQYKKYREALERSHKND